jgi:predicted protein tyrosine phosphatase
MKPVSISVLTICGISELPDQSTRSVTHVLSILDPDHPDPEAFGAYVPHHRTVLRFHDAINPAPGVILPEPEHVEAILRFGDDLAQSRSERASGHLQVHPQETEDRLLERLAEIRPQAWPNSRMVGFADDLLSRDGRLTEALRQHYGRQIRRFPHFVELMKDLGRGREVEMAA